MGGVYTWHCGYVWMALEEKEIVVVVVGKNNDCHGDIELEMRITILLLYLC